MDKENLLNALRLTRPGLGGDLVKGLSSYHFAGNKVTAFNGSLLITSTLNFEFPVTGAIEGNVFFKLLSELGNEIELVAGENALMVKSGRSKTVFPVEASDTEMFQDAEESGSVSLLPTDIMFAAGLKRCMLSMSGKGIPQEEIGVHVFIEGGECRMYSTNAITYSRFVFPLGTPTPDYKVFLPAAFCEQLIFLYAKSDSNPQEISVSQKYVRARFEDVEIRSSFYANPVNLGLRAQIDEGVEEVALVDLPVELIEAVRRSEIVAGDSILNLTYGEEDKLYLKALGAKNQRFYEEVDLAYPNSGGINIAIRCLKEKLLETCKEIGFGDDYMVLIGKENFFDYVVSSRH